MSRSSALIANHNNRSSINIEQVALDSSDEPKGMCLQKETSAVGLASPYKIEKLNSSVVVLVFSSSTPKSHCSIKPYPDSDGSSYSNTGSISMLDGAMLHITEHVIE